MRLKIKSHKKRKDGFTPFSVILTANDIWEATEIHDRVAIKITDGDHAFIGDIFTRSLGVNVGDSEYDI